MTKITRTEGDTYPIVITVVDAQRVAIPLTSESFTLNVASSETSAVADIFTQAGTIIDADNGKVTFDISGSAPEGTYYYDIRMTDTATRIRTIAKGSYEVCPKIGS